VTSTYLVAVGIIQLGIIYLLELTGFLRYLTRNIFLDLKQGYPNIENLFDNTAGTVGSHRTDDVLRITNLVSALFASAAGLLVGAITAVTIGIIGTRTRQKVGWSVDGAYIAGGICVAFLFIMLIAMLLKKVQDHAEWKNPPKGPVSRFVRNGLSLRTPNSYRLILLVTSCYLVLATSQYESVTPGH
jgi:hypothetical protein